MNSLNLAVAFVAGVVSFFSPCVLPIIPGFLAYLSGSSLSQANASRAKIFLNSVFFVLGFSLVFAALGVLLNTILHGAAHEVQNWLSYVGGVVIIFFGLYLTGLIHVGFLEREHKISVKKRFHSQYLTSLLFGAAFAAGWTPCVGAVLASIIGLAASAPGSAFSLLLTYSIGLGIPFLIVGLFTSQAASWINRHGASLRYVNMVFGVLLIVLGILIFTGSLPQLANFGFVNSLLLKLKA